MTFYATHTQKARQKHQCRNCRQEIKKAELYARHSFIDPGFCYNIKLCLHCHQLASWLYRHAKKQTDCLFEGVDLECLFAELNNWGVTERGQVLPEHQSQIRWDDALQRFTVIEERDVSHPA